MTNYLVYGRVSTTRQAERELSIPAQVKACQKYGMDHHWNLAPDGIYEERVSRLERSTVHSFRKCFTGQRPKPRSTLS